MLGVFLGAQATICITPASTSRCTRCRTAASLSPTEVAIAPTVTGLSPEITLI